MFGHDWKKMTFMIEQASYPYNGMPFRLKNIGVTCQRMMNRVFQEEIDKTLEEYMDDITIRSGKKRFIIDTSSRCLKESGSAT